MREPVRLLVQQPVERIEAARLTGDAVESLDARVDQRADLRARAGQRGQPPLDHFLLTRAQRDVIRVARGPLRQIGGGGEDDFELVRRIARVIGHPAVERVRENPAVRVGRNRQDLVVVRDDERAVAIRQLQLPPLECLAVLIPENRDQHLVGELVLHRMPFDVEEPREARARSVFEHVEPPRIRRLRDPHVVWHHVEHVPHAARAQRLDPGPVVFFAADVGIETRRIDDVVAVRAAGDGLQVRRGVRIGDAERVEIVDDRPRVTECEAAVELQSIR